MNLKKGLKKEHLKYNNRSLILKNIFKNGPMSKKKLAEAIHLTPAALTLICNDMLKQEMLLEVGEKEEKRAGRKEILLDINYNYAYVFGLDIKKDKTILALSNIGASILDKIEILNPNYSDDCYFELIKKSVNKLLSKNKIDKEKILGLGISMIGIVNPKKGISVNSNGIWNRDVHLKKKLEDKLSIPVTADNDTRNLAIAHMYQNKSFKDMIFLKYGPQIGSTIIRKGEIFLGKYFYAGEMGHSILEDGKDYCPICKRRGCLESSINFDRIISKIKNSYIENKNNFPILKKIICDNIDKINIDTIFKAIDLGAIKETELIKDSAKKLAITLLNSMSLIDPEMVILYGKAFDCKKFNEHFQNVILDFSLNDEFKKIRQSDFDQNMEIYGSLYLAIEKFFYIYGKL